MAPFKWGNKIIPGT